MKRLILKTLPLFIGQDINSSITVYILITLHPPSLTHIKEKKKKNLRVLCVTYTKKIKTRKIKNGTNDGMNTKNKPVIMAVRLLASIP